MSKFLAVLILVLSTAAYAGDHPGADVEHDKGDWTMGCTWGEEAQRQACVTSSAAMSVDRVACLMGIMTPDVCTRADTEKGLIGISPGTTDMTWTMHNHSGYALRLGLFSQYRAKSWHILTLVPNGHVDSWTIHGCYIGEKICYGMLNKDATRYWGVGESEFETNHDLPNHNEYPCDQCCWVCGKDNPDFNLTP